LPACGAKHGIVLDPEVLDANPRSVQPDPRPVRSVAGATPGQEPIARLTVRDRAEFDGAAAGAFLEAKDPAYAWAVRDGAFRSGFDGSAQMLKQAQRQLTAANAYAVRWMVAEQPVAGGWRP
jgi:hypothetical protein